MSMTERCVVCARNFAPQFAFQVAVIDGNRRYFCALDCRRAALGEGGFAGQRRSRRLAILNQKGGTGKTTTAINLAAGIAARGFDVLLVDCDAQGNVGASLGIRGERTLYHVLTQDPATVPDEAVVPVRNHFDVITSDATLAQAEVYLARLDAGRARVLADRMGQLKARYQYIVLDCGPSLSLLNQNALSFVDEVIIPVSCDYLALVGVKQVLKTLKDIDKHLGHAVKISGVVPTFFDARTRLAREAVDTLSGHFKERLYEPIRRSTRLAEAPSHRQTIFEYAPDSAGAEDYRRLVDRYVANAARPVQPSQEGRAA
ncbi:MAG TPA: ParA family protein [Kofleriaceae bacterium]|nr:ParA family protein [Kofleriaceae bacterium]